MVGLIEHPEHITTQIFSQPGMNDWALSGSGGGVNSVPRTISKLCMAERRVLRRYLDFSREKAVQAKPRALSEDWSDRERTRLF